MNKLYNQILLPRQNKVVIKVSSGKTSREVVLSIMTEIAQLGYTLSGDVLAVIETFSEREIAEFKSDLIHNLRIMVGAHVEYQPLFKNFPNDVPDDLDFFIRRIVGLIDSLFPNDKLNVLSCGHAINPLLFDLDEFSACPICLKQVDELQGSKEVVPLKGATPLKVISLGSERDALVIFSNLLAAKSSISEDDKEIILNLVEALKDDIEAYIPQDIVSKENIALLSGSLIKHTVIAEKILAKHVKTATDVLRLAAHLSGGDISLKTATRFKLKNSERNIIMALLDKVNSPLEDMNRYRMRWIRLGEVLHIGAKKLRYSRAYKAFDTLRNAESDIVTFNGEIEREIKELKLSKASGDITALLKKRPGEFARRLDIILRTSQDESVIDAFESVIDRVSTSILLALMGYFKSRDSKSDFRAFLPKGNIAKIQFIDSDDRAVIKKDLVDKLLLAVQSEMIKRFSEKEPMGCIYIDPALKSRVIPFSQRSATKSLSALTRGSRVSFSATNCLRMFLYWKENEKSGCIDVDLSAGAYGDNWNYITHLSYTKMTSLDAIHSGDIRSAPFGAAEFIDINIAAFIAAGIRYVVMNVFSFTSQFFDDFECLAGFMEREKPSEGGAFEAITVKNKFDVTGKTRVNLPIIFDLQENEAIWTDISLNSALDCNNIENNNKNIVYMSKACESLLGTRLSLYDLFMLHATARNATIDIEKDELKTYDHVFDDSISIDDILANWM